MYQTPSGNPEPSLRGLRGILPSSKVYARGRVGDGAWKNKPVLSALGVHDARGVTWEYGMAGSKLALRTKIGALLPSPPRMLAALSISLYD